MRIFQVRIITLCQQVLALGVVLAVLTPASGVISLDIVGEVPGKAPKPSAPGTTAALSSATVPTKPVVPGVTEVPLTTEVGDTGSLTGRTVLGGRTTSTKVVSRPQAVSGYGAVGVTWAGEAVPEGQIILRVRTETDGEWSDWQELEYHDDHGPDPDSPEARTARPGTEPTFVGEVDDVQVDVQVGEGQSALPQDLSLAIIAPGASKTTESETPAAGGQPASGPSDEQYAADADGAIKLRAALTPAMPTIYTRAQWGADESIRNKAALRYGTVSAGFVHHTVNANDYTEDQVPGILRSIYAYHVKSRGWSDIGYNYLVDRFGRIWEGRYGGVDKNVVGAHTLGYNEYSFAMSAIGNFDLVQPSDVMLRAYGQLFAWKLAINGVDPASTAQVVGKKTFQAINGHRDAGKTACPGQYLYAQLPTIRAYAAQAAPTTPPPPAGTEVGAPSLQTNLVGSTYPDLVVRRASDGRGLILPTGGMSAFRGKVTLGKRGWSKRREVLVSPDLNGDGIIDLVSTDPDGVFKVRPGTASGKFGKTSKVVKMGRGHDLLAAAGDITGDGRADLVARKKGKLVIFRSAAKGGFAKVVGPKGFGSFKQLIGPGDITGDGLADLMARDAKGRVFRYAGDGNGGFGARTMVPGNWADYNRLMGGGDYTGDGRPDLLGRASRGAIYVIPSRGDGTFGVALGPTANLKDLSSITAAGNLVGESAGDIVGVKGDTLYAIPNRGTTDLGAPIDTGQSFVGMTALLNVGDWNRDGFGDVIARDGAGNLQLFAGNGQGQLAAPIQIGTGFGSVANLAPVGDITGDGLPDLVGTPSGGAFSVYPGTGTGIGAGLKILGRFYYRAGLPSDLSPYDWVLGAQDMQSSGIDDFLVREKATGYLYLFEGRRSGTKDRRILGEGLGVYDLGG